MLGLLWYFACLVGGFIWVLGSPSISSQLTLGEIVGGGIAVGTIAPAYITYLVACCLSMLESQTLIIANAVIIYLVLERTPSFLREFRRRASEGILKREGWDTLAAWGLTAALGAALYPLYSSRMIPEENGKVYSGGSCWADLPIHMHMAESFLSGRNADVSWGDMHSPVFAGEKMAYPFIPDWHTAVMIKIGSTMRTGFLSTGFVMSLSFWCLLYFLALRVTRSRLAGVFAILLTIGAGGQGGINILLRDGWERAINTDVIQNDVSGDGKVFWFAFLPHVFLPQRGANFAYPLVLFVLLLVWAATDNVTRIITAAQRRGLLVHAAGLCALLPLCQAHSFIGAGIVVGVIFALDAHKWLADLRILWAWVQAGVVAVALGGPQMLLFKNQATHGHGGHFIQPGWIHKNHEFGRAEGTAWAILPLGAGGFFRFWWMSLGPAVPLCLLTLALLAAECATAWLYGTSLARSTGGEPAGKALAKAIRDGQRLTGLINTGVGAVITAAGSGSGAPSTSSSSRAALAATATGKKDDDAAVEGAASGASSSSTSARRRHTAAAATAPDSDGDEYDASYHYASAAGRTGGIRPADAADAAAAAGKSWPSLAGDAYGAPTSSTGGGSHGIAGPDVSLAEHLCYIVYGLLPVPVQDVLSGRTPLDTPFLEEVVGPMNALTVTRRGLDTLKLGLAGLLVFMIGNYINFQPWDRDNCKLYYIWVFINSILIGGLFAAPIEFLLGAFPGHPRMLQLTALLQRGQHQAVVDHAVEMQTPAARATGSGLLRIPAEAAYSAAAVTAAAAPAADATDGAAAAASKRFGAARMVTAGTLSFGSLVGIAVALFFLCASGIMCVIREYGPGMYHQLLDEDQLAMGAYIRENLAPKAVIVHRDIHITPAGCLAGRPALVGYTGWMWSHGYNYYDRDRDRNTALANALKDSDPEAYNSMRRWGVRYVLGEWMQRHHRPKQQEWEEAKARKAASPDDPTIVVPPFDPDLYLDGQLRRVFTAGRYDLYEVLGYGFPPN